MEIICNLFYLSFIIGSLNRKDNLLSVKITIFSLVLFGFIIAQFYSGSIVSSLLDTKHESIKSIQDLINSHLNLAMEDVPYDIDLFNVN